MILNPGRLVPVNGPGPNSDVAMDALRDTADGTVSLVAVYGATAFDLFHVGPSVREAFESRAELVSHLNDIAEETRQEFMQHGLFSGLTPVQNDVEYRFEEREERGVLQVYCGGRGMLLFVEPDEPVEPLVRTASQLFGGM